MKSVWPSALLLSLLCTGALGFDILPGSSLTHLDITLQALFNVTVQVCRTLAKVEGTDFTFPAQPFTIQGVATACGAPQSSKTFGQSILHIIYRNVRVDIRYALNASFHFDDEMFVQGKKIITEGIQAVKASNKLENYEAARQNLGEILHPLQDFYSHSNWVELGEKSPNSNLIKSGASIGNIAARSRATCRSCDGNNCNNNILEDIIAEKILTSGYFSLTPVFALKPKGKCSHGGAVDQTSKIEPKGGINKDKESSSHGYLHTQAANIAIAATSELLEDIRGAAGDRPFLRMMGLFKGSSKALCFVIDTTSSMKDDIATVKNVTSTIINRDVGTANEPSLYILVPFNDPGFGPLTKTTNSAVFQNAIDSLVATGGGDPPEMSLSGLQLALSAAPLNSEIFLFTDAAAKDKNLKSTVIALIQRTQSVVNFMITDTSSVNSRKRRAPSNRIAEADAQLYRDLAQASGGQAIEITKSELPQATAIIKESSNASLVTLLQAARNPGKAENFTFMIDDSVTNPTVYITGKSITFTLISPTGESQHSSDTMGSLIITSQSVGNFRSLQLKKQTGKWEMRMVSSNPYTLKVIGQSPIDFFFDLVVVSQGPFGGFDALATRPSAGGNGSLLMSLTGSDTATVTEVTLVGSSGSEVIKGVLVPQSNASILVLVDKFPSEDFVVQVKGQADSFTSKALILFQRQSPTNFRSSNLTINANPETIIVPGTLFSVPFTLMTSGTGGNFTVRSTNSRGFDSTFPTSMFLEPGITGNGTVTLSAPLNTPSGTDVTLAIEAEAPGGTDSNYIVLRFSVLNTVTDFKAPVCEQVSLQTNCSVNCSLWMWEVSSRVTDGADGTGVDLVTLKQGNGTINTTLDSSNKNITLVYYSASCCSPDMEIEVVDRVGNVATCSYSGRQGSTSPVSEATKLTWSPLFCLSIVIVGLHILTKMGIQ
ncbi:von Willebrand factor A domain-containing protein 7-like [Neolamprologus brichardi]|uniref:von Willebrand factor A domain-containing protein 7-like n=1 Tax=Neolamprologus brichardi TaxID=32507 RepID=UPI0003EBE6F2|nr:von Willebrand factor A domain-containing protein 7-like [Neolamprologus brichardi]